MISHPLSDFRRSYYMESARKIFKRKTAAYARKMDVTYGRKRFLIMLLSTNLPTGKK